jgi:hypothetical protein
MRVVFLSSAYFGYVHIYTFDRSILGDSVYASADQARHAGRTDVEARPTPKAGRSWIEQLAAWLIREKGRATC